MQTAYYMFAYSAAAMSLQKWSVGATPLCVSVMLAFQKRAASAVSTTTSQRRVSPHGASIVHFATGVQPSCSPSCDAKSWTVRELSAATY